MHAKKEKMVKKKKINKEKNPLLPKNAGKGGQIEKANNPLNQKARVKGPKVLSING
ncbi:uncharacterized protein DS421_11g331160 [Arachis hypogaea]|nr:uncharacterized protein DS421_11g331160 [Arachis hypogaea]